MYAFGGYADSAYASGPADDVAVESLVEASGEAAGSLDVVPGLHAEVGAGAAVSGELGFRYSLEGEADGKAVVAGDGRLATGLRPTTIRGVAEVGGHRTQDYEFDASVDGATEASGTLGTQQGLEAGSDGRADVDVRYLLPHHFQPDLIQGVATVGAQSPHLGRNFEAFASGVASVHLDTRRYLEGEVVGEAEVIAGLGLSLLLQATSDGVASLDVDATQGDLQAIVNGVGLVSARGEQVIGGLIEGSSTVSLITSLQSFGGRVLPGVALVSASLHRDAGLHSNLFGPSSVTANVSPFRGLKAKVAGVGRVKAKMERILPIIIIGRQYLEVYTVGVATVSGTIGYGELLDGRSDGVGAVESLLGYTRFLEAGVDGTGDVVGGLNLGHGLRVDVDGSSDVLINPDWDSGVTGFANGFATVVGDAQAAVRDALLNASSDGVATAKMIRPTSLEGASMGVADVWLGRPLLVRRVIPIRIKGIITKAAALTMGSVSRVPDVRLHSA